MAVARIPHDRWTGRLRAERERALARVRRPSPERRDARRATALLVLLVLACAYAAFADGAIGLADQARLQVGLAAVALWAAALWLAAGSLRLGASRLAWVGVALLVAFAAWSALSLLWSVQPDRTWQATNRALSYALVVVLAIAAGSSAPRALERFAVGWLLVAVVVAGYALGGKLIPGVDLLGLVDFDHTAELARLRAPIGYWNALGLLCAMAAPVALRVAVDDRVRTAWRLAAVAALFELVVVLALTYSRGSILALAAALAVLVALGPDRLRVVGLALLTGVAIVPVLGVAYSRDGLTGNAVPLDLRIDDGRVLLVTFLLCLAGLLAGAHRLAREERRVAWTPEVTRRAWRLVAVGASGAALVGSIGLAAGDRGTKVAVENAVASFERPASSGADAFDPGRLASTDSSNRWAWWQEALGAWSDRPVAGHGAGSFPLVHKRYRTDTVPVLQPHSVPLQFVSETGLLGAALALGGLGVLLLAGLARIRELPAGGRAGLGAALLAMGVAWVAHGLVDWDWDIPAVTVPALAALGILVARTAARKDEGWTAFRDVEGDRAGALGPAIALVAVCLLLTAAATSAVLPAWADAKATDAQSSVSPEATAEELRRAAADAELAARLDPLAVRPLFVAAAVAEGRDRLLDARRALLDAAGRQPDNPEVWLRLAGVAVQLADRDGFRDAARRFARLDPANPGARSLAAEAEAALAPPSASATATGTPLTVTVVPDPAAPQPRTGLGAGTFPGPATPTTPGTTAPGPSETTPIAPAPQPDTP